MLLNESNVAHHLRATPYRYNSKIACKQLVVVKTVGKMPTKVCINADVVGGILPTLPRWCLLHTIYEATPYRYNSKIGLKQWVVVKNGGQNADEGLC